MYFVSTASTNRGRGDDKTGSALVALVPQHPSTVLAVRRQSLFLRNSNREGLYRIHEHWERALTIWEPPRIGAMSSKMEEHLAAPRLQGVQFFPGPC